MSRPAAGGWWRATVVTSPIGSCSARDRHVRDGPSDRLGVIRIDFGSIRAGFFGGVIARPRSNRRIKNGNIDTIGNSPFLSNGWHTLLSRRSIAEWRIAPLSLCRTSSRLTQNCHPTNFVPGRNGRPLRILHFNPGERASFLSRTFLYRPATSGTISPLSFRVSN
jgi:hypothetical protein